MYVVFLKMSVRVSKIIGEGIFMSVVSVGLLR